MSALIKPRTILPNINNPLRRGLVVDVPFFEGAGAKAFDFAQGINTTLQGSAAWTTDEIGFALNLAGASTDYVLVKSGKIVGGQAYSGFFTVFKTTQTPAAASAIYSERAASGNDIWKVEITSAGKVQFTYRDDSGSLTQITGSRTVNDGKMHTLWLFKQGVSVIAFIDSSLDFANVLTGSDNFGNAGIEARIGGDVADTNAAFAGKILSIQLWNYQPEASQLEYLTANPHQIYRQAKRPFANLITAGGWAIFDESFSS